MSTKTIRVKAFALFAFLLTLATSTYLHAQTIRAASESGASNSDAADAEDSPQPKKYLTDEEAIRAALAMRVDIDVTDMPFQDFLDDLEDVVPFQIELDRKAIDILGVGAFDEITAKLSNVSLRFALRYILRDQDLTYMIGNEVLTVTTHEEADADENLAVRVYEVSDLVFAQDSEFPDFDTLIELISMHVAPIHGRREPGQAPSGL